MKCKICANESRILFKSLVLNKYEVVYYKCPKCDFIQTEKPFWLDEAYNNAITDLDVGLVSRNVNFANLIEEIIKGNFDCGGKFLDYAGGYGLFVRLMRDKGFDFYREDKYCENIFAKNHDLKDLGEKQKFEAVTAFEVFEHLEDPLAEIIGMFEFSDTVIFSTELQSGIEIKGVGDWWYFTPETGQHIAFYSEKTLKYVAKEINCFFYSSGNLHLMSKREFKANPLLEGTGEQKCGEDMPSLIQSDFEFAKKILLKSNEIRKEIGKQRQIGKNDNADEDFVSKLASALAQLDTTKTQLDTTKTQLDTTKTQLDTTKTQLDTTKTQLDTTKTQLDTTKTQLDTTKTQLDTTKTQLDAARSQLEGIWTSREWRLILVLQKIVKVIIPKNSFRRNALVNIWRLVKLLLKLILRGIKKIRAVLLFVRNYLVRIKPRKKRKINKNSRKVVYIGHSYHNKTKSTAFLIDYLKEFYEVEIILDESWLGQGKIYPDLSFIDESYLGVIFFQNLPSSEILKSIKNENILFFPMYDGVGHDYDFWRNYHDLKIVSFSQTLHDKLKKWGFDSLAAQYFPRPEKFTPGKAREVFFWQRLTKMNINLISRLFGKSNVSIHIHKAVDPGQEFKQPNNDQKKRFNITYSDWFETREQMWDVIRQKGIYVAPREYEGIGQSFLEAMAMGKAVVAVNNPTMNEYIEHGKTGYLFDLNDPREIDFSNVEEVQRNTHEFMKKGYKQWEDGKRKIIDFIEKE